MYLIIGDSSDPCCRIVGELLRDAGHDVYLTGEPLAGERRFTWWLDSHGSRSRWSDNGMPLDDDDWRGVLLRGPGVPLNTKGWSPENYAYACSEAQAALLAWLHTLPCPVVNRPSAELWFAPHRPLVAWRASLAMAGLATPAITITNNVEVARRFAAHFEGRLCYTPLTSRTCYSVTTDAHWATLAALMAMVPVALSEPFGELTTYACCVGEDVVWSNPTILPTRCCAELKEGVRCLARILQLAMVQVEVAVGSRGLCCVDVEIIPRFDVYDTMATQVLGTAIVRQLTGGT